MAIKWDKLTVKSQEAIQGAAGHAAENGNPEVLPLHLMAALLEDKEGVVIPVLEKVGVRRAATVGDRKRRHREAAQGTGREPAARDGRRADQGARPGL